MMTKCQEIKTNWLLGPTIPLCREVHRASGILLPMQPSLQKISFPTHHAGPAKSVQVPLSSLIEQKITNIDPMVYSQRNNMNCL